MHALMLPSWITREALLKCRKLDDINNDAHLFVIPKEECKICGGPPTKRRADGKCWWCKGKLEHQLLNLTTHELSRIDVAVAPCFYGLSSHYRTHGTGPR